jgi:hypothetical protein
MALLCPLGPDKSSSAAARGRIDLAGRASHCRTNTNWRTAMPRLRSFGFALAVLATAAGPLAAADKDPVGDTPPPVFQAVLDCKTIADPAARLTCYDKAVGEMDAARAKKDLVVTDRATVRETKRGLFGLTLPKLKLFGGGSDDDDVTEITSKVTAIRMAPDGFPILTIEDGARWKQTDGRNTFPKVGSTVRIRKAALGSYMANIDGQVAVRVMRLAN